LRPSDVPLLASYVQATIAARRYARDPSTVDLWEKGGEIAGNAGDEAEIDGAI